MMELTSWESSDKLLFTPFSLSFHGSGIHCQLVLNILLQVSEYALPRCANEAFLSLVPDSHSDRNVVTHKAGDDAIWGLWLLPAQSH